MRKLFVTLTLLAACYGASAQVDLLKAISKPPKPQATVSTIEATLKLLPAPKPQQTPKLVQLLFDLRRKR